MIVQHITLCCVGTITFAILLHCWCCILQAAQQHLPQLKGQALTTTGYMSTRQSNTLNHITKSIDTVLTYANLAECSQASQQHLPQLRGQALATTGYMFARQGYTPSQYWISDFCEAVTGQLRSLSGRVSSSASVHVLHKAVVCLLFAVKCLHAHAIVRPGRCIFSSASTDVGVICQPSRWN